MNECWNAQPDQRPTFESLVERIGHMLGKVRVIIIIIIIIIMIVVITNNI